MKRYLLIGICLIGFLFLGSPVYALSGYITSEVTWSGTIDLDGDIVITATGELTVLPGTMVTAELSDAAFSTSEGTAGKVDIIVHGTLNVAGTSSNMITFTSTREGAGAQREDWAGITFLSSGSEDAISYANIRYTDGAIYALGSSPTISYCNITDNGPPSGNGGESGIRLSNSSARIEYNTITRNQGINGGGIWAGGDSSLMIVGNTITSNEARGGMVGSDGGGICLQGVGSATIEGNTISYNLAIIGGGGIFSDTPAIIKNNIIESNTANNNSGGIAVRDLFIITGNTIRGNVPDGVAVGATATAELGNLTTLGPGNNRIYNNGSPAGTYDVTNEAAGTVEAIGNDWGTTNTTLIDAHIYDKNDNPSMGLVIYQPFIGLTVENVSSFEATPGSGQIALTWDNPTAASFFKTLILRRAGGYPTGAPQAGNWYAVGQAIGDATVIYWASGESFTDTGLSNGEDYYYKAFASDGVNYASGVTAMAIPGAGAEIKIDRPLNYPNPFKPGHGQGTTIGYMLDTTTSNVEVTIYIYNLNGTLLWKRAYIQNPGYQQVSFSGISDLGEVLGNGVYLYQIVVGGKLLGKGKMAVLE